MLGFNPLSSAPISSLPVSAPRPPPPVVVPPITPVVVSPFTGGGGGGPSYYAPDKRTTFWDEALRDIAWDEETLVLVYLFLNP